MKKLLLCTLLAVSARAASAQETQDTFQLEQVVVSATRVAQPLARVPSAVSVVTALDFTRLGLRNVADVLRTVSGAAVVQGGSYGALSSLFMRGGESDYVQVLLDGVQINSPGELFDYSALSLENIERIEIVKGPVSVLYGSDAVAGVVQLFSRQADRVTHGQVTLLGGNGEKVGAAAEGDYQSVDVRADLSGTARALQYSVGISHFGSEGALAYNNEHRLTSATARVGGRVGERLQAALTSRFTRNRFHYPTDGSGQLVDANQYHEADAWALGLDGRYLFKPGTELRSQLSWSRNQDHIDDRPDSPADTIGFTSFVSDEDFGRRSLDLHLNHTWTRNLLLTIGGELELQSRTGLSLSQGSFGDFETSADNERANRAAYTQLIATLGPVSLQTGARLDHSDAFGDFFTYRAGASVQPHELLRLRLSAGTAFKEPRFYEQFSAGFGTTGNPELEPEHSRAFEVGADVGRGRWRFAATAFLQTYEDLIQYTFATTSYNWFNIGKVRSNGIELESEWRASSVSLRAGFTALATKVLEQGDGSDPLYQQGQRLVRRPERTASLAADFGQTWNAGLVVTYVGQRDDVFYDDTFTAQRVRLPAYGKLDLHFRSPAYRGLRGILKMENALDTEYEEIRGFPARGRVVFLGASLAR